LPLSVECLLRTSAADTRRAASSAVSFHVCTCVCLSVCLCLCAQIYAKIQEGVFDVSNETFGIRVVSVFRPLFRVSRPLFLLAR